MSEEPFRLLVSPITDLTPLRTTHFHSWQRWSLCFQIVDSVIALFRVDFTGRGELADRQVRLNTHISLCNIPIASMLIFSFYSHWLAAKTGPDAVPSDKDSRGIQRCSVHDQPRFGFLLFFNSVFFMTKQVYANLTRDMGRWWINIDHHVWSYSGPRWRSVHIGSKETRRRARSCPCSDYQANVQERKRRTTCLQGFRRSKPARGWSYILCCY